MLALTVGGTIVALLSAGDPIAKAVVIAGSITSAMGAAWILAFVLRRARYDQRRILWPGIPVLSVASAASITGERRRGLARG